MDLVWVIRIYFWITAVTITCQNQRLSNGLFHEKRNAKSQESRKRNARATSTLELEREKGEKGCG